MKAKSDFITDLHWKFTGDRWFAEIESDVALERLIEWLKNFKVNLETNVIDRAVSDLPQIKGSALVIDKSMASTKYFQQIAELRRYKGIIIACDRVLPTLIHNNIIPHYVCQLDSSYLCQYFFDVPEVKKHMNEIKAIFAVTTHPLTIRLWHGQRYFFTPYLGSFAITKTAMGQSNTPYMQTGGQVASFCWLLAYNLGAKDIGVFGVTHGVDSVSETEYPHSLLTPKKGAYGTVWQSPVYNWYNEIWLGYIENLARKKLVNTYNLMKGGLLYSPHVRDIRLKDFVKEFG